MQNLNTSIILSGILLYIGNALRELPTQLWKLIKTRFGISITSSDVIDNYFYEKVDNLLLSFNNKSIMNHVTVKSVYDGESDYWVKDYSVGFGNYVFFHDKKLFIVNKYKENDKSTNEVRISKNIDMIILGPGAKKFKSKFENDIISSSKDRKIFLENFNSHMAITKRNFDTVILKDKNKLINFLDKWSNKKDFYKNHNILHTGIILYGPSGTGKSSIIRCIATYMDMDIIIIDLTRNSAEVARQLSTVDKHLIVVFEDIDCIMNINRDDNKKENNTDNEEKRKKLQLLLNFLDGLSSPSDCIFIATTNHIELLDEALIRPGRFDLKFEVGYFDIEQAKEMCDLFNVDYSILDKVEFPIKPSLLQSIILSEIL